MSWARELPSLTGPVVDESQVLSSSESAELSRSLRSFYSETGKQIQLVVLNSLEGDVLEDFSIRLAEQWKIGKKEGGSGVILLISMTDRKIRIEVGGGLEGDLTDAQAGRIIQAMTSYFKNGRPGQGIFVGLGFIAEALGGNLKVNAKSGQRMGDGWNPQLVQLVLWLILCLFMSIFGFFSRLIHGRRSGSFLSNIFFYGGSSMLGGGSGSGGGGGWSGGGGGFSGGGASGGW